jgi:hypothetical protein
MPGGPAERRAEQRRQGGVVGSAALHLCGARPRVAAAHAAGRLRAGPSPWRLCGTAGAAGRHRPSPGAARGHTKKVRTTGPLEERADGPNDGGDAFLGPLRVPSGGRDVPRGALARAWAPGEGRASGVCPRGRAWLAGEIISGPVVAGSARCKLWRASAGRGDGRAGGRQAGTAVGSAPWILRNALPAPARAGGASPSFAFRGGRSVTRLGEGVGGGVGRRTGYLRGGGAGGPRPRGRTGAARGGGQGGAGRGGGRQGLLPARARASAGGGRKTRTGRRRGRGRGREPRACSRCAAAAAAALQTHSKRLTTRRV